MTMRIYLAAARLSHGPPAPGDLPAERVFIHASAVPEVWVETESVAVPDVGRAVSFALAWPMDLGLERVTGTIERKVVKRPPQVQVPTFTLPQAQNPEELATSS